MSVDKRMLQASDYRGILRRLNRLTDFAGGKERLQSLVTGHSRCNELATNYYQGFQCLLRRMELAQEATKVDSHLSEQLRELGFDSIILAPCNSMDSCLPKVQTSLNNGQPIEQDSHQDHSSTRPWPKPRSLPLKPGDARENRGVVHPDWEDSLLGQSESLLAGHYRPHFPLNKVQSQQAAIPTLGPNQLETVTLDEYQGHASEQPLSEQPTNIMSVSSQFMTRSPPANNIEQSLDKSSELEDEEDSWPTEAYEWWN